MEHLGQASISHLGMSLGFVLDLQTLINDLLLQVAFIKTFETCCVGKVTFLLPGMWNGGRVYSGFDDY